MRAFGGRLGGNVGGVGAAVKSGVLYPGSRRIGSGFALTDALFGKDRRQIVTKPSRRRRHPWPLGR